MYMKPTLDITLVQANLQWENPEANRRSLAALIEGKVPAGGVCVLPEMFSTGFSMHPERWAEPMDGPTVHWMKEQAAKLRSILTGSLMIREGDHFYNRLIWMQPNGQFGCYDKRHLFSYAGEDRHFQPGQKRFIAQVNGWKINTLICYDLRFPVWARQQHVEEYDVLLYVANWPERRATAWNTLLRARAIENQCYVIGVNRVGTDGMDIRYAGHSQVIDPLGEILWTEEGNETVKTITLHQKEIGSVRTQFPFQLDKDDFLLLPDDTPEQD